MCLNKLVMAYIRKKKVKGNTYYYVVEGRYDAQGRVHQKVVRYLGSIRNILAKFKFWDDRH